MDTLDTVLLVLAILAFVGMRVFFGYLIGAAANRRGCGNTGWRIASLLIGPLIVWIVYLLTVHWRPLVPLPNQTENVQ